MAVLTGYRAVITCKRRRAGKMSDIFIDGEYFAFEETPVGRLMLLAMATGFMATVHGILLDLAGNTLASSGQEESSDEHAADFLWAAIQFCHEMNPQRDQDELTEEEAAARFAGLQSRVKELAASGGHNEALLRVWSLSTPLSEYLSDLDADLDGPESARSRPHSTTGVSLPAPSPRYTRTAATEALAGHDQLVTLANVQPVLIRVHGAGVTRRAIQPDDDAGGPWRRRGEIELQGVDHRTAALGFDGKRYSPARTDVSSKTEGMASRDGTAVPQQTGHFTSPPHPAATSIFAAQ